MRFTSAILPIVALAVSASAVPFKFDINNTTLAKKDFENAKFTWFNVGQGACGGVNQPNEYVVALNIEQWNNGANCWDLINISVGDQSTQAAIVDLCPGCPYGGLDLTTGLFDFFTWPGAAGSPTDPGVIYGTWDFA